MTVIDAAAGSLPNPFVGPRPIERGQPIFGRDLEIDQLYYLLSAERIVLFHSPSGAGKSSLLQAGLIPRLAQQFDVWTPVRVNLPPQTNGPADINRYVRSCNLGFEAEIPNDHRRPEDSIASMTLAGYMAGRPRRRSAAKNVVLIFDQFEEVLTVDPLALDAKREFFRQLGKLLQDPQLWAIFAIREDYLAQLDPYAELLPTHLKNRFRLDLLSRNAAAETIRMTVETGGRGFEPRALGTLISDLATMQIQQPGGEFRSEPGPYVEPLHLQVACRGLWEKLTPDRTVIEDRDIELFGDVTDSLAEYYETEIAKTAGGDERIERSIREWCGEKLIAGGNIRGQVLREVGRSGELDNRLIENLIDTHLVRGEQRAGATWYELSHDRLVEPILRNNQSWFAAHLSNVQQRALLWEREGEPESLLVTGAELAAAQRWAALQAQDLTEGELSFLAACRRRRRRVLQVRAAAAILFALLVVTSALGLIARRERDRAEMNLQLAKQAVDESLSSAGQQQAQESADSPEMEAFRKALLDKAAAFYAVFTRENSGNEKLRAEAARAHSRLGDVNRLLEQPNEAVKEYNLAIASFQGLAAEHPNKIEYRQALAYCHNWLGETLRMGLESEVRPDASILSQARKEYDEALRLQQQIHDSNPSNSAATQELARSYYNRGILLFDGGDTQGTESDFRTAIGMLEPIAGQAAQGSRQFSPEPAQELARVYNNLAKLEKNAGKSEEARALYEKAIQKAEQLETQSPQEREYRTELAQYYDNEARLLVDMNDLVAAGRRSQEALDIVDELANPAPALSLEQARILQLRSEILLAQGSPEAQDDSERERDLLERLGRSQAFPRNPRFSVLYENLAANFVELARKELAEGDLASAQLSLKSLARVLPQLTPDDKASAQISYQELLRKLQPKLSRHN
jgi:tetratricopeptide (TPR) repeat protein